MARESMASIASKIAAGDVADETAILEFVHATKTQQGWQTIANSRQVLMNEQAAVSREKIDRIVNELKEFAQTMQRDLNFHVDDITGQVVIRVIETSTDKIVRDIPEEEVLVLAQHLEEMLDDAPNGVLIESEA